EAVLPYYERFLAALPTVRDLADASDEVLHKLWQGLGYYSRVRNLQKGAKEVCERFGGSVPCDEKDLLSLCGIGSYTAGAIASIAFGKAVPAVDGNVLRVLARVLADDRNVLDPKTKESMENALKPAIPPTEAGNFTQSLIELGALVCTPQSPKCDACPLAFCCEAKQQGLCAILPTRFKNNTKKEEKKTVFLIESKDGVLLRRRPSSGLLAGLWELPNTAQHLNESEAKAALAEMGLTFKSISPLAGAKHVFTHKIWDMTAYRVVTDSAAPTPCVFASKEAVDTLYAIPSAFAAFMKEAFHETL
ncbi:MAG: A/G-specific adenine glycosylase, partial [Clostridia bacterium]|nr:A/G-specific adenine glycosylase [Clostridia bacterium]